MKKQSKNLKKAYAEFDVKKSYSVGEALKLLKKLAFEKFDTSIEVSFNLNLNPKLADQQLRGTILLPNGTGKTRKVLVVGEPDDRSTALEAGADFFGGEEILKKIEKENWLPFDAIVTTPKFMTKFGKYGKFLGPKGLMPNPKLGTVTFEIEKAIQDIKKGQVVYRSDKNGIVNLVIGKKSFSVEKLVENFKTVYNLIKSNRPASVKGVYFQNITLSTSMGPGIKVKPE